MASFNRSCGAERKNDARAITSTQLPARLGPFRRSVTAVVPIILLPAILGVLATRADAPIGVEVHAVVNAYSSGTNGGATAEATATGNGINNVSISVGPFMCSNAFGCSTAYLSYNQGIGFASNYFADGEEVSVTATATRCGGGFVADETSTTIYNKGYFLANADPALFSGISVATFVHNQLVQANHTVNPASSYYDVESIIKQKLADPTVFYMYTHGWHGGIFWDSFNAGWLDSSEVQAEVARKGNVSPALPPYNFVMIDACYSAESALLANGFGVGTVYDKAFVGWATTVDDRGD